MPRSASSVAQIVKWALIGLVFYAIWKCVKTDTENFRNGVETFAAVSAESGESGTSGPKCATVQLDSDNTGTCSGDPKKAGSCISASGSRLLPVLDPCFNMREICKQSILLEDHLFQESRRCTDCIKKHFLTIEGLAEEAITLDKDNKYNFSKLMLPESIRTLQKDFINNKDPESIAQQLRQIRKPLMNKYFDKF